MQQSALTGGSDLNILGKRSLTVSISSPHLISKHIDSQQFDEYLLSHVLYLGLNYLHY